MPLPGGRLIHQRWAEHSRPTAASAMTATCTITRASTSAPTRDPNTGTVTPAAASTVATGLPCRVQPITRLALTADVASQIVSLRGYYVGLPDDTPPVAINDVLTLTGVDGNGDPQLVGVRLRIKDVLYASLLWTRDVWCEDDLG